MAKPLAGTSQVLQCIGGAPPSNRSERFETSAVLMPAFPKKNNQFGTEPCVSCIGRVLGWVVDALTDPLCNQPWGKFSRLGWRQMNAFIQLYAGNCIVTWAEPKTKGRPPLPRRCPPLRQMSVESVTIGWESHLDVPGKAREAPGYKRPKVFRGWRRCGLLPMCFVRLGASRSVWCGRAHSFQEQQLGRGRRKLLEHTTSFRAARPWWLAATMFSFVSSMTLPPSIQWKPWAPQPLERRGGASPSTNTSAGVGLWQQPLAE